MKKITLTIEGMQCGMCEAHVCDAIRDVCAGAKVSASHTAGTAEILLDEPPDVARIKTAVRKTGYRVLKVEVEETAEKKTDFLFRRRRSSHDS